MGGFEGGCVSLSIYYYREGRLGCQAAFSIWKVFLIYFSIPIKKIIVQQREYDKGTFATLTQL